MMSKSKTSLNEQDSLQDMLDCEKQLMGYYADAVREGSTQNFRKTMFKNYTACADGQFSVFAEMQKRGYYEVMPAQKQQIDTKVENFKKTEKQLAQ